MNERPALQRESGVGGLLRTFVDDILTEARSAVTDAKRSDAEAVHDFRTAMKRWRALLRLLEPLLGGEARSLRHEARDLARELAGARDIQAALDALADVTEAETAAPLPPHMIATIRTRLEDLRSHAEATILDAASRARLAAALNGWAPRVEDWPLDSVAFTDLARELAEAYRRARSRVPQDWTKASAEELHELRQRVVTHRYQIELVAPLWPRIIRTWIGEAQRLRTRLGRHQDLVILIGLAAPHQPLARWRSRLQSIVAQRKAEHVAAASRIAARLLAERPKAFRRRLEALWNKRHAALH